MEVTGLGKLSPNMALLGFQEKWASDTDGNSAFLKRSNPSLFFIYFWYFQTNNIIFRTNPFEKMLYPSSIWHRDSNPQPSKNESPPIPLYGLPTYNFVFCFYII